jgi:probable rRNA maturation factor
MRELNRTFRGRDAATDVLAFPAGRPAVSDEPHFGDIVIAVPVAARQARERGHSLARELALLALHGYLHLAGYDHEVDDGTMRRLERRVARRLLHGRK